MNHHIYPAADGAEEQARGLAHPPPNAVTLYGVSQRLGYGEPNARAAISRQKEHRQVRGKEPPAVAIYMVEIGVLPQPRLAGETCGYTTPGGPAT